MANNIGNSNATSFFSILIPGGSTGLFNGCSNILGDNLGSQYGDLMGDCVGEVGYNYIEEVLYIRRKECLKKKCSEVFANITEAKEGCLFLANFLEVATDPIHNYKEIECLKVLKDRY